MSEFIDQIAWDSPKNLIINGIPLIPTVLQDENGIVLGTVYSSKESLTKLIETKQGYFYSRDRGLWLKSPSGINCNKILNVMINCNKDSLLVKVVQRGNFCHNNCYSCFQEVPNIFPQEKHFVIGVTYGRGEQDIYNLLNQVGIHIYKSATYRNFAYKCKTHLHHSVKILPCKPKDASSLLEQEIVDLMVSFSDCFLKDDAFLIDNGASIRNIKPTNTKTVNIVCAKRRNEKLPDEPIVYTEYLGLTREWIDTNSMKSKVIDVHGNTEQYVADGYGDVAVVVMDTGETIRENNLQVFETLYTSRLGFYFKEETLTNYPRFFRELKNGCMNTIYFFSVDGPNGYMSNFFPCKFVDDEGREWKSSEHYYQAHKFIETDQYLFEEVRLEPTPKSCYKFAYNNKDKLDPNWVDKKDIVMRKALEYKFSQNDDLRNKLISTNSKKLVEHAMRDFHYGCGSDGTGKNMLGILLMEIRDRYIDKY